MVLTVLASSEEVDGSWRSSHRHVGPTPTMPSSPSSRTGVAKPSSKKRSSTPGCVGVVSRSPRSSPPSPSPGRSRPHSSRAGRVRRRADPPPRRAPRFPPSGTTAVEHVDAVASWAKIHTGWVMIFSDGRVLVSHDTGPVRERWLSPAGLGLVQSGHVTALDVRSNTFDSEWWTIARYREYVAAEYAACPPGTRLDCPRPPPERGPRRRAGDATEALRVRVRHVAAVRHADTASGLEPWERVLRAGSRRRVRNRVAQRPALRRTSPRWGSTTSPSHPLTGNRWTCSSSRSFPMAGSCSGVAERARAVSGLDGIARSALKEGKHHDGHRPAASVRLRGIRRP